MRRTVLILAALAALPGAAAEDIVAYTIRDGRAIPESLTGTQGDPEAGRALYLDAVRTGCAGCHGVPGEQAGEAPALGDAGARLSPGELRLWIVSPETLAPETRMPAYYLAGQRAGIEDPLHGGPRLTAAEVEDLVAYLAGLTGPR